MIVDTHLHLIYRSLARYPWLSPPLDSDFLYETYAAEARRVGIVSALHVEADVAVADIGKETAFVLEIARRPGSLVAGVIAGCRPENDDFARQLEQMQAEPLIKGFRRLLHDVPPALLDDATFLENIRRLGGTGRSFDIFVRAEQLPRAITLADRAPDVQFVLDHCGTPNIVKGLDSPWRDHMRELGKRPNVVVKVSGVVAYADPLTWTLDTLRPYVEHTVACFGWDRVVFGTDWPVLTTGGSLSTWVAAAHALLGTASDSERHRLFAGNARRIWRLPEGKASSDRPAVI